MATPLEQLVLDTASLALVVCTFWAALTLVAGVCEHLCGVAPRALRAVTPQLARQAVALTCGAALGSLAATPVAAVTSGGVTDHQRDGGGRLVTGLPLPERPSGRPSGRPPGAAPVAPVALPVATPAPTPASAPVRVTVAPGDSLWTLAQDRLPDHAAAARVDRAWRAVYAENRHRIGADPDLLIPGTTLRLPPDLGQGHRNETRGGPVHDPGKDRP